MGVRKKCTSAHPNKVPLGGAPTHFPKLGELETLSRLPRFFFEMTPFRKPKRTAFRRSKDSATPERRGDPLRSGVRPRPETPSPRPPDGDTPTDETAAAAQNDGCEKTPEAPAPAHHESAVQIPPFSFVARKRKYTLFVHGRGGRGTMAVVEVKQVRTWDRGWARASFKRDGYLKNSNCLGCASRGIRWNWC